MKRAACVSALALLLLSASLTTAARADDVIIDVRAPVRYGFAYTTLTRGPAMSFSWGVAADLVRITRDLTFQLVFDFESWTRLDLDEKDPRSSFSSIGLGGGLFYVGEAQVALGIETVLGMTLDVNTVVGGGVSTRLYVYPFYMRFGDAMKHKTGRFTAWVKSSFSFWAMGRIDWTDDGNGLTLAFGGAVDIARIIFAPYIELLGKKIR